jgi:hypothetical protein
MMRGTVSDSCSTQEDSTLSWAKFPGQSQHPFLASSIMLNRDVSVQNLAAGPVRRSRLQGWLKRRARQLLFLALICAGSLLLIACGAFVWRSASLFGLPDIGDPFDVTAFRSFRVPEDQDAVILFRQAAAKVPSLPSLPQEIIRLGPAVGWSQADPRLREWSTANRDALELFRQSTNRPDGILHSSFDWKDNDQYLNLGPLVWLALLEGARSEEQGEMAAAWMWYRTVLRMRVHVMRRGSVYQRLFADRLSSGLQSRIASWAADRRTDGALLRRALEEVRAFEPKPEWDSFSLKVDYLFMMNALDSPSSWVHQADDELIDLRIAGENLPPNLVASLHDGRQFLANEPERSRRVVRLVYANWLAYVDESNARSGKPAVRASFRTDKQNSRLSFYAPSPMAPAGARAVSPSNLASWLMTARNAKRTLTQWPWPSIRISERREYRAMVVLLAEELYRRERGAPPPSEAALVGPYLDHLPGDGSDELDDGTVPTVEDSRISIHEQPE